MKIEGTGRTRLTRFAAVTIPAGIATAGLGFAIVQGMVGAALTSADAFTLKSTAITSDSLKVRPGSQSVAGSDTQTIYAETGTQTSADGVNIAAAVPVPLIGAVTLTVNSTDPTVSLPGVILNAKTLGVSDKDASADGTDASNSAASLSNVDLGETQSAANFKEDASANNGYVADGFALAAGSSTLNSVNAKAYAIHLSGLSLDNLSLGVALGDHTND